MKTGIAKDWLQRLGKCIELDIGCTTNAFRGEHEEMNQMCRRD